MVQSLEKEASETVKKATIDGFLVGLSSQDRDILREHVALPTDTDTQQEVMKMTVKYGYNKVSSVSERCRDLRDRLNLDPISFNEVVIERLEAYSKGYFGRGL